jgi:hypothetical protein
MFGGAYSGDYIVHVRHSQEGLINAAGTPFVVGSTVTSVSPMTGSIYGGTILTITGTNFGTVATDNPVSIVYNGALGATSCFVQTTSATQITCKVDDTITKAVGDAGEVVVFLKTSEEATCPSTVCQSFQFTDSIPSITAMSSRWNAAAGTWEIVVTGVQFPTALSEITMTIDGEAQTTTSATMSEAVFTVTNVTDGDLSNIKVLFASGKPAGHSVVDAGLSLTPKLVSISPSSGSVGGTLIRANIQGVGTGSTLIDLLDQSGASMCESVEITAYGSVNCQTRKQEISASGLQVQQGAASYASAVSTLSFSQLNSDSSSMASISALSKTGTTMIITGTNFPNPATATVSFEGVAADSVTIDSTTQVTATWTDGVPLTSSTAGSQPVLRFEDSSNVVLTAI